MIVKEPNGIDLLRLLIELLADQEHVKINYELEGNKNDDAFDDKHGE